MLLNELLLNIPHEIIKGSDKIEVSGISLNKDSAATHCVSCCISDIAVNHNLAFVL